MPDHQDQEADHCQAEHPNPVDPGYDVVYRQEPADTYGDHQNRNDDGCFALFHGCSSSHGAGVS